MRTRRILIAVVVLLGGTYAVAWQFARSGRGFFSPDTFQVKSQREILLPLTEMPLYRSQFQYHCNTSALVTYLVEKGHWTQRDTGEPRWRPLFHWNEQWRDGEAPIYSWLRRDPHRWINWSEANPELAAVLWPKALSILRSDAPGGYAEHVMFIAENSKSVDEFRELVHDDPELRAKEIQLD